LFVLFHSPHSFIIAGHGLHCLTSCFTGPSLLGMACILSFHTSSVDYYWAWLALFRFMLHRLIITGNVFYYFTSCFTYPSLLGMICSISLHHTLGLPYCSWFVLFDVMLHWFIINGHCLYCFTSLTGSSLLGLVCIVSLDASVVHTSHAQ
jgi:hypothetical protein